MPTKDPQITPDNELPAGTAVAMQQAIDAVVWGTPIVSYDAMREAFFRDAGCEFNDIIYFSRPADWKTRITTPNASSLYVMFMFNTGDGPVIVDVPPAIGAGLFGSLLDAWQVPKADIGPHGEDGGKGGRYVLLPPGQHDTEVADAIPVRLDTYNGYCAIRAIPEDYSTDGLAHAIALIKHLRVYPAARLDQPPDQIFIDMAGKLFDGIVHFDERFFASLARMVDEEPAFARDADILGVLATLGVEKGKPFAPDAALRALLGDAARAARDAFIGAEVEIGPKFWPGRHWMLPDPLAAQTGFTFVTDDGLDATARGRVYFLACAPPARLGKATVYLAASSDTEGNLLDGSKSYRLHVPAKVPAKQFWACTVYAAEDGAFFRDAPRVEINSYDKNVATNPDGSVDVYVGPESPAGHETNWIYTARARRWFVFFRFYGPEAAVFERSWQLPDLEPYTDVH